MSSKKNTHANKLTVTYANVGDVLHFKPFSIFLKYVQVFDLYFIATESCPDDKVLHGASILYQYIDNDDDGIPDNKLVYDKLVELKATMVMFCSEKELEKNSKVFDKAEDEGFLLQDLEADETCPGSTWPEFFDASLEECFHLVTAGYNETYPKVFGLKHGTSVANAMDKARGGYFEKIPRKYPEDAWFTYYDKTCGYCDCMMVEYMYWGLTTILGAQAFRADKIADEWRCPTKESFKTTDKLLYELLTDPQYKFATVCPEKLDKIPKFKPEPSHNKVEKECLLC